MLKLCVGADSVEDLEEWISGRLEDARRRGLSPEQVHTTRMVPTRSNELVEGGSLYWVIKGNIQCRQRLLAIRPFTDVDGIQRCHLVLDPTVVRTQWQPRRAFQGWRYFRAEDVPVDLGSAGDGAASLPPHLRQELAELGLL